MDSGETEHSFLWLIENYSYSNVWFIINLASPDFAPQGLGGSAWNISLHPGYLKWKNSPCSSVFLKRSAHDAGPEHLFLKPEISIMTADGSTLYSEECEQAFSKGDERGFEAHVDLDELFVRRNTEFLPGDTLGVRCRMRSGERTARTVTQWTARTRIGIQKISFIHRVEKFSALRPEDRKTIQIPSQSKKGCVFASSLCISNAGEEVKVQVVPSYCEYKIWNKKFSLIDVFGNTVEMGEVDYRFDDYKEDLDKLERRLTKQFLLDNRGEYLPNDELSLFCEYTFTTGKAFVLEESVFELPMVEYNRRYHNSCSKNDRNTPQNISAHPIASKNNKAHPNAQRVTDGMFNSKTFCENCNAPSTSSLVAFSLQKTNNDPQKGNYNAADKLSKCPNALDDFKTLYNDQLLADIVLKTAAKSFAAHKNVLCARSSVFRAMLGNDMRERNTDCIRVDDLEDETVERLLLFLYSDHLEELRWESALRLYYVADKYDVERLKVLCSSFLLDNLTTSNAGELLLLADTHSDAELKKLVEDFILENDEEVFWSDEWEKFSESNPQLAMKTMKLKYKKKREGK